MAINKYYFRAYIQRIKNKGEEVEEKGQARPGQGLVIISHSPPRKSSVKREPLSNAFIHDQISSKAFSHLTCASPGHTLNQLHKPWEFPFPPLPR